MSRSSDISPSRRIVTVGDVEIGAGALTVIAGPCAVEDADTLTTIARSVADSGATVLRGGAYKPRTSPYSFQGLGAPALSLLRAARELTGIPIVTELLDVRDADEVAAVADLIQIGARNMHNTPLLRVAAELGKPVLLKRNPGATLDELMGAVDHLAEAGQSDVILCERGIRTFEPSTRYTLDLAAVPVLRSRCDLPIIVDPSHAAGDSQYVGALACAAVAAGADGVMLEVHPQPERALSDGKQSLSLEDFARLSEQLMALAQVRNGVSMAP